MPTKLPISRKSRMLLLTTCTSRLSHYIRKLRKSLIRKATGLPVYKTHSLRCSLIFSGNDFLREVTTKKVNLHQEYSIMSLIRLKDMAIITRMNRLITLSKIMLPRLSELSRKRQVLVSPKRSLAICAVMTR